MDNQVQFIFTCPHCGQQLEAEQDMVGMELECPACGKPLQVPPASTVAKNNPPKLQIVSHEEEATSNTRKLTDQAKKLAEDAATSFSNTTSNVANRLVSKWNALEVRQKNRVIKIAAAFVAAFVLLSCFSSSCSAIRAKRREREAIRSANAAVEKLSSDMKARSERLKAERETRQRELAEEKERLARKREEEQRRRDEEEEQRRTEEAEAERKREEAERKREEERVAEERKRQEEKIAEERKQEEARLLKEREAADKQSRNQRYAYEVLSPLGLKPTDFGWKSIPDSPQTAYAIAAKAALQEQSRANWLGMAQYLAKMDDRGTYVGDDIRKTVDLAKTVIERVQARARMTEKYLSPDCCHLEPNFHVQKSIQGRVSLSLKGKYYADCVKKQREGDYLGLLNTLPLQYGQNNTFETYIFTRERDVQHRIDHSAFSLVCKTDIVNNDNWRPQVFGEQTKEYDKPQKLGFLTIRLSHLDSDARIRYFGDNLIDVDWKVFQEKLPTEDGYMEQGWNLMDSDVYILHTNFEKTYEPHVREIKKRVSALCEKMQKEVDLGDVTEEDARTKIIKFAQDEVTAFARVVENQTLEDNYRDKVRKAKEQEEAKNAAEAEATLKMAEAKAEKELLSLNFGFKVYVSRTLVARGISVTMLGENAAIWRDLQSAYTKKDWKHMCDIIRTRCNKFGEKYWSKTDDWDSQIDHAISALTRDFNPTFSIKINGEDITKLCEVVFFGEGQVSSRGLDNYFERSANGNVPGSYRISRHPLGRDGGDFAIVHIDDLRDAKGNAAKYISTFLNSWNEIRYDSESALRGKRDAREITDQQFEAQLKTLRTRIKGELIRKSSWTPVDLKLAK